MRREKDMATNTLELGSTSGMLVNDVHSQLNAAEVHRIVRPGSVRAIQDAVRAARAEGRSISIAGGRHAMGG